MHCPPASSWLPGPRVAVPALGAFAVVSLAVYELTQAWPLVLAAAMVLAAATAGAAKALSVVSRRSSRLAVMRWGHPAMERERRREAIRVTAHAGLVRAPYELPAAPLAIAAPKRYGASPGDASAVTIPAVVPGARDGAKVER